jgi:hypothetical protein
MIATSSGKPILATARLLGRSTSGTGPAEDAEEWTIYKITTDSAGNVLSEQSAVGQWSSKESLQFS